MVDKVYNKMIVTTILSLTIIKHKIGTKICFDRQIPFKQYSKPCFKTMYCPYLQHSHKSS